MNGSRRLSATPVAIDSCHVRRCAMKCFSTRLSLIHRSSNFLRRNSICRPHPVMSLTNASRKACDLTCCKHSNSHALLKADKYPRGNIRMRALHHDVRLHDISGFNASIPLTFRWLYNIYIYIYKINTIYGGNMSDARCIASIAYYILSRAHAVFTQLEVVPGNFQQVAVCHHHRLDGLSEISYVHIIA